jgi:hypothetical protein
MPPQTHGRSCRTSSTLQHHSPGGAPPTVIDSYIQAGTDGFLAGAFGTRHDNDDARPLL